MFRNSFISASAIFSETAVSFSTVQLFSVAHTRNVSYIYLIHSRFRAEYSATSAVITDQLRV